MLLCHAPPPTWVPGCLLCQSHLWHGVSCTRSQEQGGLVTPVSSGIIGQIYLQGCLPLRDHPSAGLVLQGSLLGVILDLHSSQKQFSWEMDIVKGIG